MMSPYHLTRDEMMPFTKEVYRCLDKSQGRLAVAIRGPSSFGKTHLADFMLRQFSREKFTQMKCEAEDEDDNYCNFGKYHFREDNLENSLKFCADTFLHHLKKGTHLILVSNSLCGLSDLDLYRNMAVENGYWFMVIDLFVNMRGRIYPALEPHQRNSREFSNFLDHLFLVNVGVHDVPKNTIVSEIDRHEEASCGGVVYFSRASEYVYHRHLTDKNTTGQLEDGILA